VLQPGDPAPAFDLPNQHGEPISLAAFAGQRLVLWFFPRADTDDRPYDDPWARERRERGEPPRCTRQACAFRDRWGAFRARNATLVGVSTDTVPDLRAFAEDFDLPFDLLSDPDGAVARRYDSLGTKTVEGTDYEIALRNTFVVDETGVVREAFLGVSPVEGHASRVLDALDRL
jgi:peroxiredoxin Q/BCP